MLRSSLLLLALSVSPGAGSPPGTSGRIVYVAEEPASAWLQSYLEGLEPDPDRRLVIQLGGEPGPGVDRVLEREDPGVDDPELARAVDDAALLELRGGTFMGWYDTLYPSSGRTRLAIALHEFAVSEKTLVVTGGAAAFLSGGTLVPLEELERPERNPRRTDPDRPRVASGLGPRALFDADAWPGGSPLRLLQALRTTHIDLGFYFVGEAALELERDPAGLTVKGQGRVLLLDLRRARRPRERVEEARVSVLKEGDRWDFREQRVLVPETRRGQGPTAPEPLDYGGRPLQGTELAFAVWHVATGPERALTFTELAPGRGPARWELSWDADSRIVTPESQTGSAPAHSSALSVPLRVTWGVALDED